MGQNCLKFSIIIDLYDKSILTPLLKKDKQAYHFKKNIRYFAIETERSEPAVSVCLGMKNK